MNRCGAAVIVAGLLSVSSMAADFPTLTGPGTLVLWLDAADATYSAGSGNVEWQDRAGGDSYGGLFTVPGWAASPTIGTMQDNNLPVVYFNGSNVLRGESPGAFSQELAAQWTFFFVLADVTNVRGLMDTAHNNYNPIRFNNNNNAVASQGSNDGGGVRLDLSDSAPNGVLFSFTHSGTSSSPLGDWPGGPGNTRTWYGYTNGQGGLDEGGNPVYAGSYNEQEGQVVGWFEPQFGAVNGGYDGGGVEGWYTGGLAEVIVFKGVLSDEDRQSVEVYLMTKYAIAGYGVPEPATMVLLALGSLAMLRRRVCD